jgi:hypothetical protein
MILERYRQKRNFRKTSEPRGSRKRTNGRLRFVIQKHDASHLHYDLRLESRGDLEHEGLQLLVLDRRQQSSLYGGDHVPVELCLVLEKSPIELGPLETLEAAKQSRLFPRAPK